MYRTIIEKLQRWKDKDGRKPLILKGARQIGKTYILQEFGRSNFRKSHYINFEKDEDVQKIFQANLDPKLIIQKLGIYLETEIEIENDLIVFDEIQAFPRALTSLKYFCEELPELALCAAGSLLGIQLTEESFPVGKIEYLHMFPMSFPEFLKALGKDKLYDLISNANSLEDFNLLNVVHSQLWDLLRMYFVVGGLPEVVELFVKEYEDLFKAFTLVREKQLELIDAYNADIAKHSGKQNSMHIERTWRNVSVQLSQEHDANASKFKFKDVIPGASRYAQLVGSIDWLIAAGLIIKVPIAHKAEIPISAYCRENCFKLFIFDIGILGALGNLPFKAIWDYDYGTYKGFFAENYVAVELVYLLGRSDQLYSWNEGKSEIEFLRELDAKIIPIEVKAGHVTRAKSLKVFGDKYDPDLRVIMSAKELSVDNERKMHKYPLYLASQIPIRFLNQSL